MVHDAVAMLIDNLRGISKTGDPIQYSPTIAMEKLKALTGEDFGYDADAWEKWFKELETSPNRFRKRPDNQNLPADGNSNLKIE